MTSTTYKVVGIQIVPKQDSNTKNIVTQVAWNRLGNCRSIFEKLVQPSSKKDISLDIHAYAHTFNVVGIMDIQKGNQETLMNMRVSQNNSMSKSVIQQFNDLVRTVH